MVLHKEILTEKVKFLAAPRPSLPLPLSSLISALLEGKAKEVDKERWGLCKKGFDSRPMAGLYFLKILARYLMLLMFVYKVKIIF